MLLHPSAPEADIGVIVGRFQVHELHEGHRALIDSVRARHQKVAIFLGSTPGVLVTRNNPLDFMTRRLMLQAAYPEIDVLSMKDQPCDKAWSEELDRRIEDVFEIGSIVLYGSRDGFAPAYTGKFPVVELEATQRISGTEIRRSLSNQVRESADFRHGIVYAAHNRHPTAYPTVDIAILRPAGLAENGAGVELVLVRKRNDLPGQWRFPGGFFDPRVDTSLEGAAVREAGEETSLTLHEPEFVGTHLVDDWRYRNELDGIVTTLFTCAYLSGSLKAADDVSEARWFSLREPLSLIPEHEALGHMLIAHLKKEQTHGSKHHHPDR